MVAGRANPDHARRGGAHDLRTSARRQDPAMTLLHGFPSSSHDWAKVAPGRWRSATRCCSRPPRVRRVGQAGRPRLLDPRAGRPRRGALGAGGGDRDDHRRARLRGPVDAGAARPPREGALAVDLVAVHLLNGGLYPDLHRPEPVQTALLDPEQGPRISAGMTAEAMADALRPTFAPQFDHAAATAQTSGAPRARRELILHKLIRYMPDRETHGARWVDALENDGRAACLRVGDARPDLGRSHRRADPGADARPPRSPRSRTLPTGLRWRRPSG